MTLPVLLTPGFLDLTIQPYRDFYFLTLCSNEEGLFSNLVIDDILLISVALLLSLRTVTRGVPVAAVLLHHLPSLSPPLAAL